MPPGARARSSTTDLGSPDKVLIDLACSSHNAMWESRHRLLFEASLEWLTKGTVNGDRTGLLAMGDEATE